MKSEVKAVNRAYELSFNIPAQLAPLSLAFELQTADRVELSRAGQRFAVPIGMSAGRATRMGESCSLMQILHACPPVPYMLLLLVGELPLILTTAAWGDINVFVLWHAASAGASSLRGSPAQKNAVDFAVRSRGATAMSLLLARAPRGGSAEGQDRPSGCLEIALDPVVNRTGDLWHICVEVQPHKHARGRCLLLPGSLAWPLSCGGRTFSWVAVPAGAEGSGDAVLRLEGGCRGGLGRRWPILPR